MNKEQQELLDEAYKNFEKWYNKHSGKEDYTGYYVPNKKEFIRLIKTDTEFSEKWGLKIEERELTYNERYKIWFTNNFETGMEYCEDVKPDFNNEYYEPTPTKLITVTYNNKTIENYE